MKTLEEAFTTFYHLVKHYDEGTQERKKNIKKLKEKYTKEEPSSLNDKPKTKKPLKC